MAKQQNTYVYWFKKALGALDVDITFSSAGIAAQAPGRVFNLQPGGAALSALGTDAATTADYQHVGEVFLPCNKTLTGVGILNGTTVGTDDIVVALYDSSGTLLANSDLAGTLGAGADAFQEIPFTSTYAAKGPATYFVGVQLEGTTHQFQTLSAATPIGWTDVITDGSFGTVGNITAPSSFTADEAPIFYLY